MSTRIQQYLHRPNSTELGLSGTHDTYLSVNIDLDIKSMFPNSIEQQFVDVTTNKRYSIKSAIGREFRINQMGEFYRDREVRPGDEIVIQKVIKSSGSSFFIDVNHFNRVLFYKYSKGYDVANIDRLSSLSPNNPKIELPVIWNKTNGILTIEYAVTDKKRSDSPEMTDFYRLTFNGSSLTNRSLMLTLSEYNTLSLFSKFEYHDIYWED